MSKIEWTEKTWNPTIGCTEVSPGCTNCYAAKMAWRLAHIPAMQQDYWGLTKKLENGRIVWTGEMRMLEHKLLYPLGEKNSTTFFVNSMSDLFHKDVPFSFIDKVFAVMALTPQHTYQVLTKRADRMLVYFQSRDEDMDRIREAAREIVYETPHLFHVVEKLKGRAKEEIGEHLITGELLPHLKKAGWFWDSIPSEFGPENKIEYDGKWPLQNVWLGVSVENQKAADERIPKLLQVPAAIRFLSCEPLLGPVFITHYLIKGIHWVITGGESGHGARPTHPDWFRGLRDQCEAAGVSFFFKQWGEFKSLEGKKFDWRRKFIHLLPDGTVKPVQTYGCLETRPERLVAMQKVGKKAAGRTLDGRTHDDMPKTKEVVNGNA